MRVLFVIFLLVSLTANAQRSVELFPQFDSLSRKFGYADSRGKFLIRPRFDEARKFSSLYASVRVKKSWGIIDTSGKYILAPSMSEISVVHRGHFLESGPNYRIRSLDGTILLEYLCIPGPFEGFKSVEELYAVTRVQDVQLLALVMTMMPTDCHHYAIHRLLNNVALYSDTYAQLLIDYVLDFPAEVAAWIERDKQYEILLKSGDVECCGN
jgi:hypothetical protein